MRATVALAFPVQPAELAVEAVAGVVDQHVHRAAGARGRRQELVRGASSGQVEHHHLDPHAVAAAKLRLQLPEPLLAPGDQGEVGAAGGKLAGEVGPEPAGRPR
jgi:hypothetical protein